jgi:hypothetical protein
LFTLRLPYTFSASPKTCPSHKNLGIPCLTTFISDF